MYLPGQGTSKDFAMAHQWFAFAEAKDVDAKSNKKFIEKRLTPEQIEESKQFAEEWRKKIMKMQ